MMIGQDPLRELSPFFRNQEELLKSFATRMTELFPSNKDLLLCEDCNRNPANLKAVFSWRGIFHNRQTSAVSTVGILVAALGNHLFHFLMPTKQINYTTTHTVCQSCFAQTSVRLFKARLLRLIGLSVVIIAAMILAAVIVFGLLFVLPNPSLTNWFFAVAGMIIGIACLIAGLAGLDRIARWPIPKPIKFLSKPPLELIDICQQTINRK